jgi:biotin/methionine sulfoxide reductase
MTHQRTLTAAHWGVYEVEYDEAGKATRLHPFAKDPDPSPIGLHMLSDEVTRLRVRRPAVRKSWLEHRPGSHPERRGRGRSSSCRGTKRWISSPTNWRA